MNFDQQLKTRIRSGEIDTVIVAFPDVFGRLVGKRFTAEFFLDQRRQARHARLQLSADGQHRDGSAGRIQARQLG